MRPNPDPEIDRRRGVMALCAQARAEDLADIVSALAPPAIRDVRPPEAGLVMLRGRAGGDGAAFNLGEATVARATVEVDGIGLGFAYQLGRDLQKARHAAVIDALWQSARRDAVEAALLPVRERIEAERARDARKVAATRVNFFTLVRGED